ncbi:MAG: hypothetical protein IJH67_13285 [Thermoguttaceae bacterium]|nr:hypothetical protein [Thermoguttaceae bacterium]
MKQTVFVLSFALLLLLLPFAIAAEKPTINYDMDPVYPRKLDPSFYDGKIVLLYYWTLGEGNRPDPRRVQEITSTFQNLNKLQMQLSKSGVFTVAGSYVGTDNASAMNVIRQCRPMFPVYVNLLCQAEMPKANQCSFVLLDADGQVLGSGTVKEVYLTLQHSIPGAMMLKRMKSLPVKHPLEGMNLVGKEVEYYGFFEPGKPWKGPYMKIEASINKNPDASGSQESIKMAIDEYLTTKLPEILEKAKAEPAAYYDILNMLSKSVKGMPGEESVNEILKPLQADKNVAELAKQIANIKKFKATSNTLSPDALKKRCEPLIASLKKLLNKPTLSDSVKAEAEKWMAQLEALSNGSDGGPVPADGDASADGDAPAAEEN